MQFKPTPSPCPPEMTGDQKLIWDMFESVKCKVICKNLDYGSSVFQPPIMAPGMPSSSAILVRMSDKINRLKTLLGRPDGPLVVDESTTDTMMDLGVYAILYVLAAKRVENKAL